jgi:hypothetical protein
MQFVLMIYHGTYTPTYSARLGTNTCRGSRTWLSRPDKYPFPDEAERSRWIDISGPPTSRF